MQQATESLQGDLGETEIPNGETELIRVSGSGYVKELGGAGWIKLVGPSLTLGFDIFGN